MISSPLVTIIIPTYNREKVLPGAINSVLAQTYQAWELIIVDDRSLDNTERLVQEYMQKDPRIKYVKNTHAQGQSGARNNGIEVSQGEYIAFLDSDDSWKKDKLTIQVARMMDENNSFSCTLVDYINYEAQPLIESGDVFNALLVNNFITMSTVIIKKEVIEKAGFFDETIFLFPDHEIWLRVSRYYKLLYIEEILATYVRGKDYIQDAALKKIGGKISSYEERLATYKKIGQMYNLDKKQKEIIEKFIADHYFSKGYELRYKKKSQAFFCYITAMRHKPDFVQIKAILKLLIPNSILRLKHNGN